MDENGFDDWQDYYIINYMEGNKRQGHEGRFIETQGVESTARTESELDKSFDSNWQIDKSKAESYNKQTIESQK